MTDDPTPHATSADTAVTALTPAPMGLRVIAVIIDTIIIGVVFGALAGIFGASTETMSVLSLIIGFAYYIVLEATQGKTLGKMALGLRTVGEGGQPLTWGTSAVRNLLRIVDGLLLYLVGFIIAMTNDKRQRLGDMAAKTMVIRD